MNKNKINFYAMCQNKEIYFYGRKWADELLEFKTEHDGKHIQVSYEMVDYPEFFQHKYYRGYLLPDIAFASGEKDLKKMHIMLKREFLYSDIQSGQISDIKKKHFRDGIFIMKQAQLHVFEKSELLEYQYIKGIIIIVNSNEEMIGYIPSTATLNYDEMDMFINNCEERLFMDLQGCLGNENRDQEKAGYVRELAKSNNKTLHEILKRGHL